MMQAHPLAELLPVMTAEDLQRLTDDIQANGLNQPIITYQGQILDGRHRLKACQASGVAPRFTDYTGTDEGAAAFVISANLARRQLTKAQLALAGAKLKGYYAAQAKARQLAAVKTGNQTRHGGRTRAVDNPPETANHAGLPVVGNSPPPANGKARDHAAQAVGVHGKTIDIAEKIMKKAIPEIVAQVEGGELSLNEAGKIAALGKDAQKKLAAVTDPLVRKINLREAAARSQGKKQQHKKPRLQQAADAPGTHLVRWTFTRLQVITAEIERTKLSPEAYAEQLMTEFDWTEPLLVQRLCYISKAIDMVAKLEIMGKRARDNLRAV